MAWFFGFLLFQAGEFLFPGIDLSVIEASSQLASEVSVAHWHFHTPTLHRSKVYLFPEVEEPTQEISKFWKEPVERLASIYSLGSFQEVINKVDCLWTYYAPGNSASFPVYLLNCVFRL